MKFNKSVVLLLVLISGCAAQEKQVQSNPAISFDCTKATAAIKTLNSEKARVAQEIDAGASSIVPTAAVAHIFGPSQKESVAMGTAEYNTKLDDTIAEIKTDCNLQ